MKLLKKKKGFTLIELVIVIVILGILAVTAAPTFVDLSGDAETAAADGVRGAMLSADQINLAASQVGSTTRAITAADAFALISVDGFSLTGQVVHGATGEGCFTWTNGTATATGSATAVANWDGTTCS